MAESGLVVMVVMMVIIIMNIHLEAQDERINDSSTSAARVMVKYEEVDTGKSGAIGKSVKKLSKVKESSKSLKSLKGLKILHEPLVWRNVYQSIDLPSIAYKELKLPLQLFDSF